MNKVLILVNGEYGDYHFCKDWDQYDFIICADNGMSHARALGIMPHLIVGDFDSSNLEDLMFFREQGVPIETFSPHKDATDTELAVEKAMHVGATEITIWGGAGTRLDHTLANVQLLYKMLQQGIKGELVNPNNRVWLTHKKQIIKGNKGQLVSLIPFSGEVKGITTKHLSYPLTKAILPLGSSLGISNVLDAPVGEVCIEEGILIVILAND